MKFSFERRLLFAFGIIFLGIIVTAIISYQGDQASDDTDARINHSKEVLYESDAVLSSAKDIVLNLRAYLATNDAVFLQNFYASKSEIFKHIDNLKSLTEDNLKQQSRTGALERLTTERINLSEKIFKTKEESGSETAGKMSSIPQSLLYIDNIRNIITEIQKEENNLLAKQKKENNRSITLFNNAFLGLLAFMAILLITIFLTVRYYINTLKKSEEKARKANEFFDVLFDHIPDMIFMKDAKSLRFTRVNKAGEKLLGYERNVLIGKDDYDFFPKEQADNFTSRDRQVLKGGKLIDIPEEPINSSKGISWMHTKKIPLFNEQGEPQYLLGISEDITEHKKQTDEIKQLNEELEKNYQQLQYINKELEAYSYSMTYVMLSPMKMIDECINRIADECLSKCNIFTSKQVELLQRNSAAMRHLIEDVVNLSTIGKKELVKKKTDMQKLVNNIIYEVELLPENNEKHIKFITGQLQPALCEESLIRLVWRNLIYNAVRYSSGREQPVIETGSFKRDHEIIYFVKDNGVGFDMKDKQELLEVFQQMHEGSEVVGSGGALALAKRIIYKHGGRVWAESEPDKGATFYFSLTVN